MEGVRDEDWSAIGLKQAIKREAMRMRATIPIAGRTERLNNSNKALAFDWVAEWAEPLILPTASNEGVHLVPVPCHDSTITNPKPGPPTMLAAAIDARLPRSVSVLDCLRWKVAMERAASGGGSRNARELYENLAHVGGIPPEAVVFLIDDVTTSGGHLRACAAYLAAQGATIEGAICAVKALDHLPPRAFEPAPYEYLDFDPSGRPGGFGDYSF